MGKANIGFVYGTVPAFVKEEDSVILDADKKMMNIYEGHNLLIVLNVVVSIESEDMDFVRRHTIFKKGVFNKKGCTYAVVNIN